MSDTNDTNRFRILNSNIEIIIYPWLLNKETKKGRGITLDSIHIIEGIGGGLASGVLVLSDISVEDFKLLGYNQNYGTISIKDLSETSKGNRGYDIPFFIKERSFQADKLKLNILCVKSPDFFDHPVSMSYDNIDDAIHYLTLGNEFHSNIESDLSLSNLKLTQMNETNYDFLKKLCFAYKKDTVFSFGFEGLSIKDITLEGDDISNIITGYLAETKSVINFRYDERLNTEPLNPWKDYSPSNPTTLVNFNEHYTVRKPYETLLDNFLYNSRLYSGMYSSIEITGGMSLPLLKIGDVVYIDPHKLETTEYELPKEIRRFVVAKNEFFYASTTSKFVDFKRRQFSFITTLVGLNKGPWGE